MNGPAKIAVFLVLALACLPPLLSNKAFSHGDAPSTCENRYDAYITSMTVDNGTQTFDPISDSDLEIDAQIDTGYDVEFTLHTANASSQNNTSAGTTWYRHTAFGFGNGVCVDDAGPDEDIRVTVHVTPILGIPNGYTQEEVQWGSSPGIIQLTYKVVWHDAADPEPPAEEQPPQEDDVDEDSGNGSTSTSNDEPEDDDDKSEYNEPDDIPVGTVISPFIFKNETTVAPPETNGAEQPQENIDTLTINGTLASFQFMNEMQLYILSGNWTIAMNGTAIIDFGANFTMVRADGSDRQVYSLDNLTVVNDSDLLFGNDTVALTSALDYHYPNGTITRMNATITLEKLDVIKIEAASLNAPLYGVVDKVVRNVNGETQVMARQFDMI